MSFARAGVLNCSFCVLSPPAQVSTTLAISEAIGQNARPGPRPPPQSALNPLPLPGWSHRF